MGVASGVWWTAPPGEGETYDAFLASGAVALPGE